MTAHVDYTQLHEQLPHLTLEESTAGYFTALDQHGRIFTPPHRDLDWVIRFMRVLAFRGAVTLDEESITYFRARRVFGEFSVRAGSLSEGEPSAEPGLPQPAPSVTSAAQNELASPSESDLPTIGVVAALPQGAAAAGDKAAAPMHLRLVN